MLQKRLRSLTTFPKTVYGDPKWLEFILGQLIANSIKYKKETLTLTFSTREEQDNVLLYVSDDGIGIRKANCHVYLKRDLPEQMEEVMQNPPESACICVGNSVIRCICPFLRPLPVGRAQLYRLLFQRIQDCF